MTFKKITVLVLFCASTISCIKAPLEEEVLATAEEIQNALGQAWGDADPLSMKKNDFLYQETEQKIDSSPTSFYALQEGATISNVEEQTDKYIYSYLYQHKSYKQGEEGAASSRNETRTVGKALNATASAMGIIKSVENATLKPLADDNHLTLGFERVYNMAYSCFEPKGLQEYCKKTYAADSCAITCTNLKVKETLDSLPDLMKTQPHCGGFENCKIKNKKVSYDWSFAVTKGSTVEKQTINYSVTVSPDLPFFARMTEYCFRQLFQVPQLEQKLLVTSCTKLKNFKPGAHL